jgi:hypothetical protein
MLKAADTDVTVEPVLALERLKKQEYNVLDQAEKLKAVEGIGAVPE